MDPYLERREIWTDFHDRLVTHICGTLQPCLRPRCVALVRDRAFDLAREEVREPLIHIVETAAGNRLVTAIEVLSPANKETRAGRSAYLHDAEKTLNRGTNLVEIDLWPCGESIVHVPQGSLMSLKPWRYVVAVSRHDHPEREVYLWALEQRLPRVGVPLAKGDADVPLDLQSVFARRWEEGPYPELLRYDGPPPGGLTPDETRWAEDLLRKAGMRA